MKPNPMQRIEQKIIKLYGLILLTFKRFDLIKYFIKRYFLTYLQKFKNKKEKNNDFVNTKEIFKDVKTRKFLGRLCGYSRESYIDKNIMNFEKAHLKAYLNGSTYFKYKGKNHLVLKTF